MKNSVSNGNQQDKRILRFEDGRMYFSKYTERKFFFALTLIMLLLGAILRLGGWQ
jgi:hypothetical protein